MNRLALGTRVRFKETLEDNGEFGRTFAHAGAIGRIVGYGAKEGYFVQVDEGSPFGAALKEFEVLPPDDFDHPTQRRD